MEPSDRFTTYEVLQKHGVDRRSFLKFCTQSAAALGLSAAFVPKVDCSHGDQAADSRALAARPGMHLLQRIVHSLIAPHCAGRPAEHDFAGLRRHAAGCRRIPGGRDPPQDHEGLQGPVSAGGGRQRAHQRWRRVLHRRRGIVPEHPSRDGRGREGDRGVGILRFEWLRASRQAESDRREADQPADHRTSRLSTCPAVRRSPK